MAVLVIACDSLHIVPLSGAPAPFDGGVKMVVFEGLFVGKTELVCRVVGIYVQRVLLVELV